MKISLWGMLNNYPEILEGIKLPEEVDFTTLKSHIIIVGGENEVMYANPVFMDVAVKAWFRAKFYEFDKLAKSMAIKYEPIENYDRIEEWEDISENSSNSESSSSGTLEDKKQAFDSYSYQPERKSENETSGKDSVNGKSNLKHTARIHGNIGVTTSQQMLQSEREVAEFDIYNHIATKFEDAFTLTIY